VLNVRAGAPAALPDRQQSAGNVCAKARSKRYCFAAAESAPAGTIARARKGAPPVWDGSRTHARLFRLAAIRIHSPGTPETSLKRNPSLSIVCRAYDEPRCLARREAALQGVTTSVRPPVYRWCYPVGSVPARAAAARPAYSTGVAPTMVRKSRMKCAWSAYPSSYASRLSAPVPSRASRSAASCRR